MTTTIEKLGIDQLKKASSALSKVLNTGFAVLDDGKVDLKDLGQIPSLISAVQGITEIDFDGVMPEIKDLSLAEAEALAEHFRTEFNIKSDSIEFVIEEGVGFMVEACKLVKRIKDMVVRFKEPTYEPGAK